MTHTFWSRRAACSVTAFMLIACGGGSSSTPASTAPSPSTAPSQPTAMTSAPARPTLPSGVTAQMVQLGDSLFNTGSCQRCHGKQGTGGQNGPALAAGKWLQIGGSYDEIVKIITSGVPVAEIKDPSHRLGMRARGGMTPLLTDDQVRAVAAYVYTISHH